MKKWWRAASVICALALLLNGGISMPTTSSAEEVTTVLFVGNSKTLKNDIPGKFYDIAQSKGHETEISEALENGVPLSYFSDSETITEKSYDFVVLQEQTEQSLSYDGYLQGAGEIADLVREKNPDVRIVLRKTWVYASSDESEIEEAYGNTDRVAEEIDAVISNDGTAFYSCRTENPDIELFEDEVHQSEAGAYLAACCIYAAVFNDTPVGASYPDTLTESEAEILQEAAENVMS